MSIIVALVGPIEYWWNTPEDPRRFGSQQAVEYRDYRETMKKFLASNGYLVYAPWDAFFGPWDERAQAHNDFIISIADIVVNLRPLGVPGKGTDHEIELAHSIGKHIVHAPQSIYSFQETLNRIQARAGIDKASQGWYN